MSLPKSAKALPTTTNQATYLARLPLQRMRLIPKSRMVVLRPARGRPMFLQMPVSNISSAARPTPLEKHSRGMFFQSLFVHRLQHVHGMLDVSDERIASAPTKVLANDDAHELQLFTVRRHGIGGDDPAALSECMGDLEFIERMFVCRIEAECYQR